ncbi:MAG: DUF3326 domain-containing protein [Alphaproteobacteria bacterium]|nr:MAG: DUF3326 domain-containing protein [Alphaproteobacteria bacterium]
MNLREMRGSPTLQLLEKSVTIPATPGNRGVIEHIEKALSFRFAEGEIPVRLVIASVDDGKYFCEIGCLVGSDVSIAQDRDSIFALRRRDGENAGQFNAVYVVPTGIGAEVGGHAGDATPAAQLLASCCDQLITHPNVVNASDINELPANAHYVEGSILCRLLMGTVGLEPVRANRVVVVFDSQADAMIENLVLNTVDAARTTYGLNCTGIYKLEPPLELTASSSASGRAVGFGQGIDRIFDLLKETADDYDAVAISSLIGVPDGFHEKYFNSGGTMINPWGGIEAMLTHAVSHCFNVPSAHAPMMESREILNEDPGRVDPRMAAEAISSSFLQCVLKGLKQSPRIVVDPDRMAASGVLTVRDVSCLVIPEGCIGLPTLAALEQGIPVIAVREGSGLMAGDLSMLPWREHQLFTAENYWEAAGILSALRVGIAPGSVRRPFNRLEVKTWRKSSEPASTSRRQHL